MDETRCNKKDQIRQCGYALRGEYPVYHRFLHRGQRISTTAVLSADGIIALDQGNCGWEQVCGFYLRKTYCRNATI